MAHKALIPAKGKGKGRARDPGGGVLSRVASTNLPMQGNSTGGQCLRPALGALVTLASPQKPQKGQGYLVKSMPRDSPAYWVIFGLSIGVGTTRLAASGLG